MHNGYSLTSAEVKQILIGLGFTPGTKKFNDEMDQRFLPLGYDGLFIDHPNFDPKAQNLVTVVAPDESQAVMGDLDPRSS